jgi:alcohol dehydrogenase class IV
MARAASFLGNTGKTASVAEAASSAVNNIRGCMEAMNLKPDLKDFNIPIDRVAPVIEAGRNLEFVANSPWIVSGEEVFVIIKEII